MPQLSFADLLGPGSGILSTLRPDVKNLVRQNTLDLEAHDLNLSRDRQDVIAQSLITPMVDSKPNSFTTPAQEVKPKSLITPASEPDIKNISTPDSGPIQPELLHHTNNWLEKAHKAGFIIAGKDENPDGLGLILPDGTEVLGPGFGEDTHNFIGQKLGIFKKFKDKELEENPNAIQEDAKTAYAKGLIHKSGSNMFLIDQSSKSTLPVLENKLTNTQFPVGEKIYIDTTQGKSYAFPHFEFARNGFKLSKMLTKKYEVKGE